MSKAPTITEAAFTKMVIDLAKLYKWRTMHMRPARVADGWRTAVSGDGKGFPDLVMIRGRVILVAELKCGKRHTTAEQDDWLNAFRDAGVLACVWKPEQWDEIVKTLE